MIVDVSDLKVSQNKIRVFFNFEEMNYVKKDGSLEKRRGCRCIIRDAGETQETLGEGISKCSPEDQFRRVTGRSIAFDKAFWGWMLRNKIFFSDKGEGEEYNQNRRAIKKRVFERNG